MVSPSEKTRPFCRTTLMLVLLLQGAQARRWEDVIDVSIYAQSNVDIPRIQFAIEDNHLNVAPTVALLESQPPSDAPSSVPSYYKREEDEESEPISLVTGSECPEGEDPFKVNMYDTWGDGWGETVISIRRVDAGENGVAVSIYEEDISMAGFGSAERSSNVRDRNGFNRELEEYVLIGGLKSGDRDSEQVCLSTAGCYEVALKGGKWQEEARWDIVPDTVEKGTNAASNVAIAKGRGFTNCTFHVSEQPMNQQGCPFTCRPKPEPEEEEVEEDAEKEGEEVEEAMLLAPTQEVEEEDLMATEEDLLVINASSEPTNATGTEPIQTQVPSFTPSDAPSLVPTK